MAKKKPRDKKLFIISSFFLIVIGLLTYLNIYVKEKVNFEEKNNSNNKDNQIVLTNITINKDEEKDIILANVYELNNIETSIQNERKDYYNNIKLLEDKIISGESDKKIAYLTFDDGPYYLTNEYLRVLKENDVLATFFSIGLDKDACYDNRNVSCADTYKKIVDAGHTIANHTYSHLIFGGLYSSVDSFINQVKKQEELVKTRTGVTTNIVRFPGGSATARGLKDGIIEKLRENGYGWVDWSASDGDGGSVSGTNEAMNNLKGTINDKIEVVLLHDYSRVSLAILPDIIKYLEDNNYVLAPLFYESSAINK